MSVIIGTSDLSGPWPTQDPFLFCAYHNDQYPPGDEQMGVPPKHLSGRMIGQDFAPGNDFRMYHGRKIPGFPYHPHRGFETITINKRGWVDHSDSLGAAGRFGSGDVQWMTAGKGILHSEMFPLLQKDQDNPLEIFQIWLNLPASRKMVPPHFKMLWDEAVPDFEVDAAAATTRVRLIAGEYEKHKAVEPTPDSWAVDTDNGVMVLTLEMQPHAQFKLPAALVLGTHRTLYFYEGSDLQIENEKVSVGKAIRLHPDQEIILKNGDAASALLLLQGKPIGEPVAQHGPFVMNTPKEIQEAMADYQKTGFGGWPWPLQEQVHDRNKGRFALHGDGREEQPNQEA